MSIVSHENFILSKQLWAKQSESEFQLRDVKNLIHYTKAMDTNYLNNYNEELGVKKLFQKVAEMMAQKMPSQRVPMASKLFTRCKNFIKAALEKEWGRPLTTGELPRETFGHFTVTVLQKKK